jgi:hypothetical protein
MLVQIYNIMHVMILVNVHVHVGSSIFVKCLGDNITIFIFVLTRRVSVIYVVFVCAYFVNKCILYEPVKTYWINVQFQWLTLSRFNDINYIVCFFDIVSLTIMQTTSYRVKLVRTVCDLWWIINIDIPLAINI